ncbi:hypothetical protein [Clostridium phage Amboise]|nr:hypothetical protein [Clostridium phage Amboise]DAH78959.1 MAG TPA: hypothetical protein [Caudoviricetes sp.]
MFMAAKISYLTPKSVSYLLPSCHFPPLVGFFYIVTVFL